MAAESEVIRGTALWQRTLEPREGENPAQARAKEKLRDVFWNFRQKVEPLVSRIRHDCPELTIHDITHLDALWEMADKIIGPDYPVNPLEAFLFGGAVLLHDAALCVAGYRGKLEGLRETDAWLDGLTREFMRTHGRAPSLEEVQATSAEVEEKVIFDILRRQHAHRATDLIDITWQVHGQEPMRLLEDTLLRKHYGDDIGLLAKSHWLAVNRLPQVLTRDINPLWEGIDWQADALKIACMLRTADAAHVDRRRAPEEERVLTPPRSAYSDRHWRFQQNITSVTVRPGEDSLYYTSAPFSVEDADAWWLGHDTLSMVDSELRQVHALLSDYPKGSRPPFPVQRVHGIESPDRLADLVKVKGWTPVDAHLQVTDIGRLVKTLGGQALYGDDLRAPLRELIQNACDSIRHRRSFEDLPAEWGRVVVRRGSDGIGRDWIEVEDDGLGMSTEVVTRYLLNFTASYWGSDLMLDELPGLASKAVQSTGKFGIGFFSVFMLGSKVRVVTKRISSWDEDEGRAREHSTVVLEFTGGADCRPVLRDARREEFRRAPGTVVRVWLDEKCTSEKFLREIESWPRLCAYIAPAIDVDLVYEENGVSTPCVTAGDWRTIPAIDLLTRLLPARLSEIGQQKMEKCASFVRPIIDDEEIVGRACILTHRFGEENQHIQQIITVGGLLAEFENYSDISGIMLGKTDIAARDRATPIAGARAFINWATEQGALFRARIGGEDDLTSPLEFSERVRRFGGDLAGLPAYYGTNGKLHTLNEIDFAVDEIYIDSIYSMSTIFKYGIEITERVIFSSWDRGYRTEWILPHWQGLSERPIGVSLLGAIVENATKAWGVTLDKLLNEDWLSMGQYQIGKFGDQPHITYCYRLRRPTL